MRSVLIYTLALLFWLDPFGDGCEAQEDVSTRLTTVVNTMSDSTKAKLASQLTNNQDEVLNRVKVIQQSLNDLRDAANSPDPARNAALSEKEDQLIDARKRYASNQLAKQIVLGQATSLPDSAIDEYAPDALESITVLSNPMLPTCGASLPYRGQGAQIGWQPTLDNFLKKYGPLLKAVGRLEVETDTFVTGPGEKISTTQILTPIGTAFAISGTKIVTAGHVASLAWDISTRSARTGVKAIYFNTGAEYEYGCKVASRGARRVRLGNILEAAYIPGKAPKDAPEDYAVVSLDAGEPPLDNFVSISKAPNLPPSSFVVVVEYPDKDGRVDQVLWTTAMKVPIDGGMFPVPSIKRISPGMVLPVCENSALQHVSHDATTLNRSSGAPIFDVETGDVIAIQVSGYRKGISGKVYCNLGLRSNLPEFANLQ